MNLFDFIEVDNQVDEKEVEQAFQSLIQFSKSIGNPLYLYKGGDEFHVIRNIPTDIKPFLLTFEEKGWIKDCDNRIEIRPEYKDFHTPEEVAEMFYERLEEYFTKEKGHYYGSHSIDTSFSMGFNFKDHETYIECSRLRSKVRAEFAKRLGLKHFLEVPESRGSKMNRFETKLEKAVVKRIAEDVIPLTNFDDVKDYFQHHAFFCRICPYSARPDIKTILLSSFCTQCLAEATDEKTVALILSYTGGSWINLNNKKYRIIYPDGWNIDRVYDELTTPEMIDIIFRENERLNRLHGRVSA